MNIKILGILGAGFLTLSFIPTLSFLLMFLGLIFLGIAVNGLSVNNPKIFNNFLIASILQFIASVLFYFKLFAVIVAFFSSLFSNNPLIPLTFSLIAYFVIYYVLLIISAVYFKKSFDLIYEISSNNFFKLSGYFLVTGAVLNLFFIGLLVWIIGWVLVMIGFFTLYENTDIIEAEIIEEKKLLEKN